MKNIDVFHYLNFPAEEKLVFFLDSISKLKFTPDYWINYSNVQKNSIVDNDLEILNNIIGLSADEIVTYLKEFPDLLLHIPKLLGIRKSKFEKDDSRNLILEVKGNNEEYNLNFSNIDKNHFDKYIEFFSNSGLMELFSKAKINNIRDYCFGLEAGMDSNARKNRSGKVGETMLAKIISNIVTKDEWEGDSQISSKLIKIKYDIELGVSFKNRKFDGYLYHVPRKKLYLFEINNFNSSGSKSKASATEFKDLQNRFSKTNHEFIYITDGIGWISDKSHLLEAMEHIGKVFNYKMIENGFLEDYLVK